MIITNLALLQVLQEVFWKFHPNKRYVRDINNGYVNCKHIPSLSSENLIRVNNTKRIISTDNYRTIDLLLNESNRVIKDAGKFEFS